MRIPVKKFLFMGSKEAHARFFEKAQKIGWFEFISVSGEKPHLFPKPMEELKLAIKILKKQPVKERQVDIHRAEAQETISRILVLRQDIDRITEELRLLQAEIVKVHPLGEFDLADLEFLRRETKKVFQFLFIRHERLLKSEIPEELIFIKRELDFDYYLYIGSKPFFHPAFTEVYIRTSLKSLYLNKQELTEKVHECEKELRAKTAYLHFLETFFLEELGRLNLDFAKGDVDYYLNEGIFGIEAWIPENKVSCIQDLIHKLPIYVSEVVIEEGDSVPTYLENKGFSKIGQDLVEIYDTPALTDKDPSLWVLCAFAIFFGMIISDAGYGMLFLLASLYARYKCSHWKGIKKRMLNLAAILSCTSIVWGVLIGSYFSIGFAPKSPIYKVSLLHELSLHKIDYYLKEKGETFQDWVREYPKIEMAKSGEQALEMGIKIKEGKVKYSFMEDVNNGLLIEIALFVGLIHLSLSFLRNLYRNWSGIGWVTAMWGAFLFFPKLVGGITFIQYFGWVSFTTSAVIGEELLYFGLAMAVILAILQQGISGAIAIFKVIEVFADTLSYLRIYALGLASMIMASTFNDMGEMVGGGLIGAFVILFGHTINIVLGSMAGILHGLRLNFLEWYHHSFEGGGKNFRPLRLFIGD